MQRRSFKIYAVRNAGQTPDGESMAFVRTAGQGHGDVYLLALTTEGKPQGEPRRITDLNLDVASPAWGRNGHVFFVAGTFGGQRWLWRVAPEAKRCRSVSTS